MSISIENGAEDIFSKGALIQLSTSIWTGRVKLPSSCIQGEQDPDFITASKYLVDRNFLKKIEKIRAKARSWLYTKSLPFPIDGVIFIPKDMITRVDSELSELGKDFDSQVAFFLSHYNEYIELAKGNLGDLYDSQDYPQDIGRKFAFNWRFFILDAPGKTGLLDPKLYLREEQKFHKTMDEFREVAMKTLRETFSAMINKLVDRLKNGKKFKNTTITNLTEFLDDFSALNITNDEALAALVDKSKGVLNGVIPQELRDDEGTRIDVVKQMEEVQSVFEGSLVKKTRVLTGV